MTKEELILLVSEKLKVIRAEAGYTQDRMASVIGVSKKTLVQIEKGRLVAGWTTIVAVCALFRSSETLMNSFGGDPLEVIEVIAREDIDYRKEKTLGGKIWWKEVNKDGGYILQQNLISNHYRILDEDYYRIYSTFDKKMAKDRMNDLLAQQDREM
ncbi:helix-turn-helix domain-containing protein [Rossellomorea vietnamensis]|uniref:Helix-turn-helix domain-containing protein n=2 Tax=Rossellomorea TaxID=2837508 RepID=A0A5D4KC26_9BACI|nr:MULTISPECIES: helix-turn-helix domain-containing protein [Rossellomorea]TYR74954.1 helix-turn-helix domain-containing protein [Rossellomorea vietnamensis]TYS83224.1 helix-turn-helix domain-containing protein [Rossellomorea aquimaris]